MLQIIEAILQNAAIYTQNGDIHISCLRSADADGNEQYAIAIRDTGCGIAADHLPILFETMNDSRDASSSKYGGTGMKLTVIKKLCHALGGEILVKSTLGKGSRFIVLMPRRERVAAKHPPANIAA